MSWVRAIVPAILAVRRASFGSGDFLGGHHGTRSPGIVLALRALATLRGVHPAAAGTARWNRDENRSRRLIAWRKPSRCRA
jgi:hypothetical protein